MRLTRFRISNYRSIRELALEDLPEVVVLYGNNDVGKSNILEAIGTWFLSLRALLDDRFIYRDKRMEISWAQAVHLIGPRAVSMFRYGERQCVLSGVVSIAAALWSVNVLILSLPDGILLNATEVQLNGVDVASVDSADPGERILLEQALRSPWLCVSARRRLDLEYLPNGPGEPSVSPVDPDGGDLKLRLFRAARGTDPSAYRLFKERVVPIVTGPPFNLPPPDPRVGANSELALYLDEYPVEERGSGLQQWVVLSSLLALSQAEVAAIEEPEAHLAWETQGQVAAALRALVMQKHTPPFQLFVETHSPWMAQASPAPVWFEVTSDQMGTHVERRDDAGLTRLKVRFSGFEPISEDSTILRLLPLNAVRLPPDVVEHLGVQPGDYLFCGKETLPRSAVLRAHEGGESPGARLIGDTAMGEYLEGGENADAL